MIFIHLEKSFFSFLLFLFIFPSTHIKNKAIKTDENIDGMYKYLSAASQAIITGLNEGSIEKRIMSKSPDTLLSFLRK